MMGPTPAALRAPPLEGGDRFLASGVPSSSITQDYGEVK